MTEVRTQQSGRLEDVSPLDLLQSLGIYRRAGHVVFVHPYGSSQLWFEAGTIIDAESGMLHGAAAIHRIATHDRGEYRVEITGEARRRTIEHAGSGLIFEAARRLDEGQRLRHRLPADDAVLVRDEAAVISCASEEHARVAVLLEVGATLGEVLEQSSLGELETLEWIAARVDAGQLRATGAVRSPAPPVSAGLGEPAPWGLGLEASQPFVPSPSYASYAGLDDGPPSRRRWWIHASVGAAMAAVITLAIVWGSTDASTTASTDSLAVGDQVTVIDATQPSLARPDALVPRERPLAVGASAMVQDPTPTEALVLAPAPSRSTSNGKGKPDRTARTRSVATLEATVPPTPRAEPAAGKPDDASLLLAEARRAYAEGQGEAAYRLASRSQQQRPSSAAAEQMTLAACQQGRADAAAEALRAVSLLRRGSVRTTCKQAHGVRLRLTRAR